METGNMRRETVFPKEIPPVFLVGPRGSGKTTVARILARRLGLAWRDTDALLTAEAERSVAEIVLQEGWKGFRARESRALHAATAPGVIVATGGGMVLSDENCVYMRARGTVFYLAAPVESLYARLRLKGQDVQRPSLTGKDPLEELAAVVAERAPLYRKCAHHSMDASISATQVASAVLRVLARMHKKKG